MLQTLKPKSLPHLLQPYRSTKTRWLIFLTLGLTTTVLVSWTCALLINIFDIEVENPYLGRSLPQAPCLYFISISSFASQMYIVIDLPTDDGPFFDDPVITDDERESIPHWTRFRGLTRPRTNPNGPYEIRVDIARGWPLPALASTMDAVWQGDYSEDPTTLRYGIDVGAFPSRVHLSRRILPYKPILPGLIINTLFYTLTLFAIPTFTYRTIRHHHRLKNNRCPNCNYDLRNNPAPRCPECGWNRSVVRNEPNSKQQ